MKVTILEIIKTVKEGRSQYGKWQLLEVVGRYESEQVGEVDENLSVLSSEKMPIKTGMVYDGTIEPPKQEGWTAQLKINPKVEPVPAIVKNNHEESLTPTKEQPEWQKHCSIRQTLMNCATNLTVVEKSQNPEINSIDLTIQYAKKLWNEFKKNWSEDKAGEK